MTGILGGYTTFSAFSLDAALLYGRGQLLLSAGAGAPSDVNQSRMGVPEARMGLAVLPFASKGRRD